MPLADLLLERFKVKTRAVENPRGVTAIVAAAQQVLANNPNRLGFTIVNLGTENAWVGLDKDVSSSKGILLDANGGSFGCIWDEDFQMTAWAWWVISTAAGTTIYSLEVLEQ